MSKIDCFSEFDNAPKAIGPYSVATKISGLYFLSGQIGLDPKTGKLVEGGLEAQAKQVFNNLRAVLNGLGLNFQDVAKATIFLTNMNDFQLVNSLYSSAFEDHRPARSTVAVSALPASALVEIELIATA